jgi:hypothetical protein
MIRSSHKEDCPISPSKLALCGCLVLAWILLVWGASRPAVQEIGQRDATDQGVVASVGTSQVEDFRGHLPHIMSNHAYYYVDSINGSDSNSGISPAEPWRTLAPVHATDFPLGSVVLFKRGSSWTGALVIDESGMEGDPIVFSTYGAGDRPTFSNPTSASNGRVIVIDADWVVVEGLLVRDATRDGVYITEGSNHNVVRDIEATDVGIGIGVRGQYNLVTHNYVHDLHMVVNTPGGHDDYGAVGVLLQNSHNEIAYNRMVNCIAASYDFGVDGGGIEWWGNADGNNVYRNWVAQSAGFLEIGGGSARDTTVAYNVSFNNGRFSHIHLAGQFRSILQNFRLENNVIVEVTSDQSGAQVLSFTGTPTANAFRLRNNVFYIDGLAIVSSVSTLTHDHNLYYLSGGTALGFHLGSDEIFADPLFVDLAGGDFHLLAQSPAIDRGVDLGYTRDFEDETVPQGAAPELGAFEYNPGLGD